MINCVSLYRIQEGGHGILNAKVRIIAYVQLLNCVQLFAIPWTEALQAPLPMGSPRQGYWSGLPFPSPGHLLIEE